MPKVQNECRHAKRLPPWVGNIADNQRFQTLIFWPLTQPLSQLNIWWHSLFLRSAICKFLTLYFCCGV
jgi:hypothetical protein